MSTKTKKSDSFWISHATLVTQNDQRDVVRGHVRIHNGFIVEIHEISRRQAKTQPRDSTMKVMDGSHLVLVPGFIQTHIHLCQTLFRHLADELELLDWLSQRIWPMEAAHTAPSLRISAELGIRELLASGTTCILDMGTVRHTEALFKTAQRLGIRANIGKCLMDHPTQTPPELRETTQEALDEAEKLLKKWNGANQDRIRASFAPRFALSCTEELLQRVSRLSEKYGAIIHTHASENPSEVALVKKTTGFENIEFFKKMNLLSERLVIAHGIWLNDSEKHLIKQHNCNITHCPSSNLKLASGIADIPDLIKRGINVSLGADGAPCNNRLDAFQELRFAALLHQPRGGPRALSAQTALDLLTRNGAKALQWDNQIGSIEVGKKADIVALDLNDIPTFSTGSLLSRIVYGATAQNVAWTMVDGKVLYDRKKGFPLSKFRSLPELLSLAAQQQKRILRATKSAPFQISQTDHSPVTRRR